MFEFLRRRRGHGISAPVSRSDGQQARERADMFWQRWQELLPEVSAALGDGEPHRVDHQLAEALALVHPDLTFSLERGEQAIHALVVSSRADPELRVYTDAWKAAAPPSDSQWEYHDAVPAVPDPTQVTVNLHGTAYPLAEVRVAPQVDTAAGLIDVAVYHPGFAALADAERRALTFLPLEATLGERLAADRVGRVETAEREPQDAIGLLEFRDLVRELDAGGPGRDETDTTGKSEMDARPGE
ncbi:hypothetical protein [Halopolyspora algeriensis]